MIGRELFTHSYASQLLLDIWDSYAEQIGPQQSRLLPKGKLVFEFVEQRLAQGFTPLIRPIGLIMRQNLSGYYLFFGDVQLSPSDRRNEHFLSPGTYRLRISHADGFYQPVIEEVDIPNAKAPYPIALEPGATYPYLPTSTGLRGRVIDPALPDDANGIAGVKITVTNFPCSALTDRGGGWVYYFPEPDRNGSLPANVEVVLQRPDDNRVARRNVPIVAKQVQAAGKFQF